MEKKKEEGENKCFSYWSSHPVMKSWEAGEIKMTEASSMGH